MRDYYIMLIPCILDLQVRNKEAYAPTRRLVYTMYGSPSFPGSLRPESQQIRNNGSINPPFSNGTMGQYPAQSTNQPLPNNFPFQQAPRTTMVNNFCPQKSIPQAIVPPVTADRQNSAPQYNPIGQSFPPVPPTNFNANPPVQAYQPPSFGAPAPFSDGPPLIQPHSSQPSLPNPTVPQPGNMQFGFPQQPPNLEQLPPGIGGQPPLTQHENYHFQNYNQQYQQNNTNFNNIGNFSSNAPSTTDRRIDLLTTNNLWQLGFQSDPPQLPLTVANQNINVDSRIMRSTLRVVPQTRELLKKSRLPFGVTLQPFRDMTNLNILQTHIVRCRYCRAYINPYVMFTDLRHWRCNICFRNNEVPEEFLWNPTTKTRGEPTERPEIKCSTVEFIAPSEYMARSPQPCCYIFVIDVSVTAQKQGYLNEFCEKLKEKLEFLPGYKEKNVLIGFVAVDAFIHTFRFDKSVDEPKVFVESDIDDPFVPAADGFVVSLHYYLNKIKKFLEDLPNMFKDNTTTSNCLGSALNVAHQLIKDVGGRITVFQCSLPNVGLGSLENRNDATNKTPKENDLLAPAIDYYKQFSLNSSAVQIGIDLFVMGNEYVDLATLTDLPKYSSGETYYIPLLENSNIYMDDPRFRKILDRYLTRKIGWEAVLRIRCTENVTLHSFYGNHFVRSTDLINMPIVSPDIGMAAQLELEDDLKGLDKITIQAALLYTSSKGDRRIRVHTMCLPLTSDMLDVYRNFDISASISLLTKMGSERATHGVPISDCREALLYSAIDGLGAFNRANGMHPNALLSPTTELKFLPLFILGCLKHDAFFGAGRSIKYDKRIAAMQLFSTAPIEIINAEVHPVLYNINSILNLDHDIPDIGERPILPEILPLSYGRIHRNEVYLLDAELFDADTYYDVNDGFILEEQDNQTSKKLFKFINKLMSKRGRYSLPIIVKEDSPNRHVFVSRLIEDKNESSHSYMEFLRHIVQTIKK
ncbi:von Willebrand factor, type A domain and Zinc finger, Sec23/Sec24-type domain and Sec23/Sec24, trunk domain and Sec23/Sec24, helical domain and Sec23/Sec24 beta-sandwich domain-containing protein [Strongyloides ratti]|uniref:von Willebrand factor, type A domain and Zinc finger, Sec23/Sec24-type domain and Sec23/Sec24, trunk domain and Sec23/Sec24, helical domain and Sec23/Sec24 beta-sandwich domain-containing protein n=1 Tax=Strongyloides ratti TaxID=34506 RepID=A0A090MWU9_STRRB|nr:von Willebrand factor, type A domain and Zinc finger, Sec23/Sec24-type domain and Sec23/Sec24, trunk domain and Sec23/Sec24, helical domain and Sec23/Sec24 beta-sandwich domain-containing protein [Strongyloides ratti]CEF64314.1 von Willebrand factor, type A domain and Zinc finger, Sec23/Sec24-type domain and Sec23/Sec24, trunk domain and Sec23/Sec24, helical domain and Sec23/Sec24 beta-sandwich domain-containing protein [Strongyloides ratti]